MAEAFVTLEEAAVLEDENYHTLYRRIQRKSNEFITRTEPRDGGKDRVLVALSSLSKKARRTYKQKMSVDGRDVVIDKLAGDEVPWYLDIDLNWYIENFSKQYYEAVELSKQVQKFLSYNDGERTAYADGFARELGVSQRTLYRYSQSYLEAAAWAMKLEKMECGNYDFFKVLALCRKPKEAHTFPSLSEDVRTFIAGVWFDKNFAANAGTIEMLYSKLEEIANDRGWDYPSYQTVARYINYLMQEKRLKNAHFLAANGVREYKNKVMVKGSRNTKALDVLEMVQGDEHTFDCWVAYKNPNGKVTPIKPKLVAWIDTRSRVIMGDVICKNPNSQILKQSLLKVVYGSPGGVPKYLLIDNGRDYQSKELKGSTKNERRQKKKSNLFFDEECKGFYRSIGILDETNSLPYQPWSKAQVERFFGIVCSKFTKWLDSYTGTLTGSLTSGKKKKDINKMLEDGELLTMEQFYERWSIWLKEYHNSVHSGLKTQKEKYTKPLELFMNAENKYYKPAPPRTYASMLMMKAESVRVYNLGIKKFGFEYRSDDLTRYHEEKVDIKYDPEDLTKLYVYTKEGKFICEALSQELLMIAPRVSQKALEEHLKMQKRQLKNDRDDLNEIKEEFEKLIYQYDSFKGEVVGGIELTVKASNSKAIDNVVAFPRDNQYSSTMKDKKNKKSQDDADEFFNKKAQDALSKLRTLG